MDEDTIVEETWLSERQAELFQHRYRDGLKLQECADKMSIKNNTVKSMLGTMRNKLERSEKTVELFNEVDN